MCANEELVKFKKKAGRYLAALMSAPHARKFEIIPIISAVEKLASQIEGSVSICDAMAGSGYLAKHMGYLPCPITALEACGEMSDAGKNGFQFVPIHEAQDLPREFAELKFDIAASLASFHHILGNQLRGAVRSDSVHRQVEIVKKCFQKDSRLRHFLIADVSDESLLDTDGDWPWSQEKNAVWHTFLDDITFDLSYLRSAVSADDYNKSVASMSGHLPSNPSRWFREVVEPYSITGHADCFIGQDFIELIEDAGFLVSAKTFHSPWWFPDQATFEYFLWEKFAFRNGHATFAIKDAVAAAREYLGFRIFPSGEVLLGWKLAHVLVSAI